VKIKLLLCLIVLCPAFAKAACTGSNPNLSSTVDRASVASCVSTATNGTTITLAAGTTSDWTTPITWTSKGIIITGNGTATTNITCSTVCFDINGASATNFDDISNMTLTGSSSGGVVQISGTMFSVAFRFHALHLVESNGRTFTINKVFGLVDHVTVDATGSSCQVFTTEGSNSGQQEMVLPWGQPLSLGTINAVYYEDNTINWNCGSDSVMDTYGGGRWVFRHNTVTLNTTGEGFGGGHGTDSGDYWGGILSFEIYNNTFTNIGGTQVRVGTMRAGTGVWYNNTYTGSFSNLTLMLYRACDSLVHGAWSQCNGTGYRVTSGAPSVFWKNTTSGISGSNCATDGVSSNCAFCSGNKEIRCASDAACSAAGAGTCTVNFDGAGAGGYPCRNQPGIAPGQVVDPIYGWSNGGKASGAYDGGSVCGAGINTYIASGRDYIDTASTPKPGYTAFTYPHPLVGGSPAGASVKGSVAASGSVVLR
jgi:hypothetical protein